LAFISRAVVPERSTGSFGDFSFSSEGVEPGVCQHEKSLRRNDGMDLLAIEHGDYGLVLCERYLNFPKVMSFAKPPPAFVAARPVGPSTTLGRYGARGHEGENERL
jgi:hypothetical protein